MTSVPDRMNELTDGRVGSGTPPRGRKPVHIGNPGSNRLQEQGPTITIKYRDARDDSQAAPATDGTLFLLHDQPQKEWLE